MAFHTSGVELTLKGFSTYISNLGKIEKSYRSVDATAERLRKRVESLAAAKTRAARSEEVAGRAMDRAERSYNRITSTLENYRKRLTELGRDIGTLEKGTDEYTEAVDEQLEVIARITKLEDQQANAMDRVADAQTRSANATDRTIDLTKKHGEAEAALNARLSDVLGMIVSMVTGIQGISGATVALGVGIGVAVLAFKGLKMVMSALIGLFNLVKNAAMMALKAVVSLGTLAVNAFKGLLGVLERITRPLRNFVSGILQVAGGIAFYKWMQAAHNALVNFSKELIGAASNVQKLEIQLSGLAARDYAEVTGVSMADAFAATSDASKVLWEWLRKLAVQTPFSVDQISNSFALAQAMGLGTTKAKALTTATIDFASALGLSDEVIWRIVYNMGQMIQRGKLSGEEFRDLARNFVPINAMLIEMAKDAGMTTEAFKEMAMEGGVPVEQFLDKFIEVAGRVPGAAEKMSRTIQGVTSNIKDFVQTFLGVDILKPVLDIIAGRMDDFLDSLVKNERLMASTQMIGQTLVKAFQALTPAVDALASAFFSLFGATEEENEKQYLKHLGDDLQYLNKEAPKAYGWAKGIAQSILNFVYIVRGGIERLTAKISEFSGTADSKFGGIIDKAKTWGHDFLYSFADGMARGMNFLAEVITRIAGILTSWFKTESPPRILPEIDKWGMETMNEWLKGFLSADFDIFEDVASLAESYLRSISLQIGGEEGENLIPAILKARQGIAAAIEGVRSGAMGVAEAVRMMVDSIGYADQQFYDYINILFQIAEAEGHVSDASEKIEQAQKKIDLAEELFGIAAAEDAVAAASANVKTAQDAVNAVSEKYDAILSSLRSQLTAVTDTYEENARLAEIEEAMANQRLTDEEKARLENEKQQILLKQQIRATEEQRDAEMSTAEAALSSAQAAQDNAKAKLEALEKEVEAYREQLELTIEQAKIEEDSAKSSLAALKEQATLYERRIENLIENNELMQEQERLIEKIRDGFDDAAEAADKILSPELTEEFDDSVLKQILRDLDGMDDIAQEVADNFWKNPFFTGEFFEQTGLTAAFENLKLAGDLLGQTVRGLIGEDGGGGILAQLGSRWVELKKKMGFGEDESVIIGSIDRVIDAWDRMAKWWENNSGWITAWMDGITDLGKVLLWFALSLAKSTVSIFSSIERIAKAFGLVGVGTDARKDMDWLFTVAKVMTYPLLLWSIVLKEVATAFEILAKPIEIVAYAIKELRRAYADMEITEGEALSNIGMFISGSFTDLFNSLAQIWTGRQHGGPVYEGSPYLVGERRPEVFIPNTAGSIIPSVQEFQNMLLGSIPAGLVGAPMVAGGTTNIDRSTHVNVSANYKNVESEAGIRYDVWAALAAARR